MIRMAITLLHTYYIFFSCSRSRQTTRDTKDVHIQIIYRRVPPKDRAKFSLMSAAHTLLDIHKIQPFDHLCSARINSKMSA